MNELLVRDDIDFKAYLHATAPSTHVHNVDRWSDELGDLLEQGDLLVGDRLPWSKTHDLIRFREGEVTVWAGINGHGKSLVAGLIAMAFTNQERKVCIASLEMKPVRTLLRMLKQASMSATPTTAVKNRFIEWLRGKLYIYDHIGVMDVEVLFGAIKWTAEQLGVKHFFIDNLGLCIKRADDLSEQKAFIVRCMTLAKECGIHIHVVHHIKKLENEYQVPGKFDIKGGGEIVDYVDQAIIVYRNKKKEESVARSTFKGEDVPDDVKKMSDALLNVVKNRDDFEGRIHLWYDPHSLQYTGGPDVRLMNMMGEYAYAPENRLSQGALA